MLAAIGPGRLRASVRLRAPFHLSDAAACEICAVPARRDGATRGLERRRATAEPMAQMMLEEAHRRQASVVTRDSLTRRLNSP